MYAEKLESFYEGLAIKQLDLLHQSDRLASSLPGQVMVQVRPFLIPALGVMLGPQTGPTPTPVPTAPALAPTEGL